MSSARQKMKFIAVTLAGALFISSTTFGQITNEEVREVATSFHEWYLDEGRNYDAQTVLEVEIIEGENGKCAIDYTTYFQRIRTLGTVSEEFLQSERQRVEECTGYLSTVDWQGFKQADAYTYDEHCPFLYSYYWLRAQEAYSGVEVVSVKRKAMDWDVEIRIYRELNGSKESYSHHHLIVTVREFNDILKIARIRWKED